MTGSGIYKIQSVSHPERFYIGSAIKLSYRWLKHLNELKHNRHHSLKLQYHYNKYGVGDLVFTVIEPCLPIFLTDREQYYIDKLKPHFNICPNAGSCLGVKRKPYSKERIERLRQYRLGTKLSEEHKKAISSAQKGVPKSKEHIKKVADAQRGKKLSPETLRKISEAVIGMKHTPEQNRLKSIRQKGIPKSEHQRMMLRLSWIKRKARQNNVQQNQKAS